MVGVEDIEVFSGVHNYVLGSNVFEVIKRWIDEMICFDDRECIKLFFFLCLECDISEL